MRYVFSENGLLIGFDDFGGTGMLGGPAHWEYLGDLNAWGDLISMGGPETHAGTQNNILLSSLIKFR